MENLVTQPMFVGEKLIKLMLLPILLLILMVTITTAISMVIKHLSLDQILIKLLSSILFMVISTLETIMDIRHKNIDYRKVELAIEETR